ncbi:MAG: iolG [Anaerosporomusa subterranea]|jgi:myo-inositol 2-dehydrogenase/D-chiro-inositol 1-dehydrogenase|nr:iolG [Anaerosporomusa subterranea]
MDGKVVLGIIGVGRIGRLHAENIVNHVKNAHVRAVSDIDADKAKDWAKSLGIELVYPDYQDILTDPAIDAVLICSSTDTHAQLIMEAAKAKKHIFCEKPIDFDASVIRRALVAVDEAGVKLQIGFNRRFDHNFRKVHDAVERGAIGQTHIVKITSRDPEPPPLAYVKVSGGMFLDMTIHDFDMARYLAGSEVEEVFATANVLVDPAIAEAGDVDTAVVTLKFENGAIGVIDNSRRAVYGYDQRVEVFGSAGCISVANDTPTTAVISTATGIISDKPKYFFLERYKESFIDEMKAFVNAVTNGADTPVSGLDGLKPVLIGLAAKQSLHEGRAVRIAKC